MTSLVNSIKHLQKNIISILTKFVQKTENISPHILQSQDSLNFLKKKKTTKGFKILQLFQMNRVIEIVNETLVNLIQQYVQDNLS